MKLYVYITEQHLPYINLCLNSINQHIRQHNIEVILLLNQINVDQIPSTKYQIITGSNKLELLNKINDEFILVNGDSVLQDKLITNHLELLKYDIPICTIGEVKNKNYNWNDYRKLNKNLKIFHKDGLLINNYNIFTEHNYFYMNNIAMNNKLINIIKKFNQKYFNSCNIFTNQFCFTKLTPLSIMYCKGFIHTLKGMNSGLQQYTNHDDDVDYKAYNIIINQLKHKINNNQISLELFI